MLLNTTTFQSSLSQTTLNAGSTLNYRPDNVSGMLNGIKVSDAWQLGGLSNRFNKIKFILSVNASIAGSILFKPLLYYPTSGYITKDVLSGTNSIIETQSFTLNAGSNIATFEINTEGAELAGFDLTPTSSNLTGISLIITAWYDPS